MPPVALATLMWINEPYPFTDESGKRREVCYGMSYCDEVGLHEQGSRRLAKRSDDVGQALRCW